MVSPTVAARLADEAGVAVDEVNHVLGDVPDEALARYDPSLWERIGLRVGETAADQPSRIADVTVSGTQKTILGTAAIGGGVLAGPPIVDEVFNEKERLEAQERESQAGIIESIMTNPHLGTEDKRALIDRLINSGVLSGSGGGDGGGPLSDLFGGLTLLEFAIILMVIWFGGKALVEGIRSYQGGQ